jgi:1,4-dihydroxy-2-naphthoate octaprenyltransferase
MPSAAAGRAGGTAWLVAVRPLAQINLLLPNLAGQAAAYAASGDFDWGRCFFAASMGVPLQLMIMGANEWGDRFSDQPGANTLISGGSGVILSGRLASRALLKMARVGFFTGSVAIALSLFFFDWPIFGSAMVDGAQLAALWLAASILVYLYDGAWIHLSHRGGGEFIQSIGQGLVWPLFGWSAQGIGSLPRWPAPTFIATGLLFAFASHLITALPDYGVDSHAGKRSAVVRWGPTRALFMVGLAYLLAGSLALPPTILAEPFTWGAAAAFILAWFLARSALPDFATNPGHQGREYPRSRPRLWGLPFAYWPLVICSSAFWLAWIAWTISTATLIASR